MYQFDELLIPARVLVFIQKLDYAADQERGTRGVVLLDVVLVEDEYDSLVYLADEVVFLGRESHCLFAVQELHERSVYLVEPRAAALGHLL